MNLEKLEKLARLVTTVIEESNHLKNEVRRLQEKIQELDRKMEGDQSVIRSKVQNIKENLEKMDIV